MTRAGTASAATALALTALTAGTAGARTPAPPPAAPTEAAASAAPATPAPRPADVASPDAIIAALYDVISGDAGVARDWDRFRSLFHPAARMIPTGRREGAATARAITPEDYIRTSGPLLLQRGFHEQELARRTERFGPLLHAWSSYQAKARLTDTATVARGVNSIQLFHDGRRWWILTVAWSAETPDAPLPPDLLPRR